MTLPTEGAPGPGLWVWRLGLAVAAGLIPFLGIAYLCHPARLRMLNGREWACRARRPPDVERTLYGFWIGAPW